MIKIGVCGALGKMGNEVIKTVLEQEDMALVSAIDKNNTGQTISAEVYTEGDLLNSIKIKKPDVMVDFTQPDSVFKNAKICLENGVMPVIGTTGLSEEQLEEIKNLSIEKNTGCIIAPNFSIGAILLMRFAKEAAKYFDNAEIIELHHNQKKDAPSGTAIKTAEMMSENNNNFAFNNKDEIETVKGARGAIAPSNIHIHSVRMPGYIASEEVIFGAAGQILKISHDTTDRGCFMPGVMLAIRYVFEHNSFVYGLENIL